MRSNKVIWVAIAAALAVIVAMTPAAAQEGEDGETTEAPPIEWPDDDVEAPTYGSGGGGEPENPAPPVVSATSTDEGGGDVQGAALGTRTLTRTKKIPAAAFTGNSVRFISGCAYPEDGNTAIYAPVMGLPVGATITEFFVEGFADAGETENFTVALRWNNGDGGTSAMASGTSSAGGYVNVQDTTIVDGTVNDLGSAGRSYYVVFDADNNSGGDVDFNDHRVCHVWITYEITESFLADVFEFTPLTPCAEFDTRVGLPGYSPSEGSTMTVGETRIIDLNGFSASCNNTGADGYLISVFLINVSGINWLNVYNCDLADNEEAVIVGSPADALESVSLLIPDGGCPLSGDAKLTLGGTPGAQADVKIVVTGLYQISDQPTNRYTD